MKNQYFGDINDYRKYGLIRMLSNLGSFRTAVCWMLTPDIEGNIDGRKLSYLHKPELYRHHDPQLYDLLQDQVIGKGLRSVTNSGVDSILPNVSFFQKPVPVAISERNIWFGEFLQSSIDADLVFFDPDNGCEVPSVRKGTKESVKYLYWDELADAYAAGHSVLVYQHFLRVQRKEFITRLSEKIHQVTDAERIFSYTTPHVVFLLLCQNKHLSQIHLANQKIARAWHSQLIISAGSEGARYSAEETAKHHCPFCSMDRSKITLSNDHAVAIPDGYPVTLGHSLIIPKRHVSSFFEATVEEKAAMLDLVGEVRQLLQRQHAPDGFNIGINDGTAAGQTIMHLHIHMIPRYSGDTDDPQGGVRWIMPEKAPYWKKP